MQGPDLVISQSKDCLDNMDEWCKTHHAASGTYYSFLKMIFYVLFLCLNVIPRALISNLGLTERVLQSELSEHDAEAKVCFSVCGEHAPPHPTPM